MNCRRILVIAAMFHIAIACLEAQGPKPINGGPGSIPGSPNTGMNSPSSFPGSSPSPTNPSMENVRPILITGKVTLEDGSAPGQPVTIERICGGRPHAEGYTDPSGSFSLRIGQDLDVIADASEAPAQNGIPGATGTSASLRDRDLTVCDLRAVLAGYQSPNIPLTTYKYLDNPDIGTIILHRQGTVEGLTISATTALAPKDAKKSYEKGIESERKAKFAEAQAAFEKAVAVYPKFALAWYELGRVEDRQGDEAGARSAFAQAIAADSKYLNPYEALSMIAFRETKWQEVIEMSDKVIHLDPYDYPGAYYYNAVANLELKNLDPAEKSARTALKLGMEKKNPQIHYVLGIILAQKGSYAEAAESLKAYLKAAPDAKDADKVRKQLADLDKTIQAKSAGQP